VESRKVALVTRCMWELQEMTPEVEGLLLIGTDGFVIASTLRHSQTTSRMAAVSSALVGLAKQVCEEWERGNFQCVNVTYQDETGTNYVAQLMGVTASTILVAITKRVMTFSLATITVPFNIQQTVNYVSQVLSGVDEPPQITWM
jgi:predicted regulator of Ras-like GTPase activity (Roadblock/LC7/MglB family)